MPSREEWAESFDRAEERLREIHANLHLHPDAFYLFHSLVHGMCRRSNYSKPGFINDTQCYVVSSNIMRAVSLTLWPSDPDQRHHLTSTSRFLDEGKWPANPDNPNLVGPEARFHGHLAREGTVMTEEQTFGMFVESSVFSMLGWLIMRYVSWTRFSCIRARTDGTPEELADVITRIHVLRQPQPQPVQQIQPAWNPWQSQQVVLAVQREQTHNSQPLLPTVQFASLQPTQNQMSLTLFHDPTHTMLPLRPMSSMGSDHMSCTDGSHAAPLSPS